MGKRIAANANGRAGPGFTLVEIILTLALVGLLSSIFVLNIGALVRQGELETLENEFWKAARSAHQRAVFEQRPYALSFDEERRAFVLASGANRQLFRVDTSQLEEDAPLEVSFRERLPEDGFRLVRGELVTTREIASAVFHPDGTCSPFSVSLVIADYRSSYQIDPWTCAELVAPAGS